MGILGKYSREIVRFISNTDIMNLRLSKEFRFELKKLPRQLQLSVDLDKLEKECSQCAFLNLDRGKNVMESTLILKCNLNANVYTEMNYYLERY